MNKAINKDILSKQTKLNRKKAIEAILFDMNVENKAVKNIIDSISQQSFEVSVLKNKLLEMPLTFEDMYGYLNQYKKGIIPVILALVIKENIKYMVAFDQLDEITIDSNLLDREEEDLFLITLKIVNDTENYESYEKLFPFEIEGKNIFSTTMDGMYRWFFNLDIYTLNSTKGYMGLGKYKLLSQKMINFKNSLRVIQKNPYWYLSQELPRIIGEDTLNQLKSIKEIISNSLLELKKKLMNDINTIFPENIQVWYENLTDIAKKKIYENGEEKFFDICLSKYKESELVEKIAFFLTGVSTKHWDDSKPKLFYNRLLELKKLIESTKEETINSGFVIKYLEGGKEEYEKILNVPFSSEANIEHLVVNEIKSIFSEYRNCINHHSKVAIALKLALEDGAEIGIS